LAVIISEFGKMIKKDQGERVQDNQEKQESERITVAATLRITERKKGRGREEAWNSEKG